MAKRKKSNLKGTDKNQLRKEYYSGRRTPRSKSKGEGVGKPRPQLTSKVHQHNQTGQLRAEQKIVDSGSGRLHGWMGRETGKKGGKRKRRSRLGSEVFIKLRRGVESMVRAEAETTLDGQDLRRGSRRVTRKINFLKHRVSSGDGLGHKCAKAYIKAQKGKGGGGRPKREDKVI